jgi:hypothetical protein
MCFVFVDETGLAYTVFIIHTISKLMITKAYYEPRTRQTTPLSF